MKELSILREYALLYSARIMGLYNDGLFPLN